MLRASDGSWVAVWALARYPGRNEAMWHPLRGNLRPIRLSCTALPLRLWRLPDLEHIVKSKAAAARKIRFSLSTRAPLSMQGQRTVSRSLTWHQRLMHQLCNMGVSHPSSEDLGCSAVSCSGLSCSAFFSSFRRCLPARMFIFFSSASLEGSSFQRPRESTSIMRSLSQPIFVRTSASICEVSIHTTLHSSSRTSRTWATSNLTLLSLGWPASLLIVDSRLLASVNAMIGFLGYSCSRLRRLTCGFIISLSRDLK